MLVRNVLLFIGIIFGRSCLSAILQEGMIKEAVATKNWLDKEL